MPANKPVDLSAFHHLYPFCSHYLRLNGWRCHYLDEGRGEPVLMLHGNPTWSFYYRNLIQALRPRFRTVAPDHIGCGLSDKPPETRYGYRLADRLRDVERLLEHLSIASGITLVGHDWGGMIGTALALRHPGLVHRLIFMNTAAFLPPGGRRLPVRLRLLRNADALAREAVLGLNLFARAAVVMAACRRLTPAVKAGLLAPYNCRANRIATWKFVRDIPLGPGDPSYALVRQADEHLQRLAPLPTLICWGMRDFVFDRHYLAEWRRRLPAAEIYALPDAGHYVLEDAPSRVITRVSDFLDRTPAGTETVALTQHPR